MTYPECRTYEVPHSSEAVIGDAFDFGDVVLRVERPSVEEHSALYTILQEHLDARGGQLLVIVHDDDGVRAFEAHFHIAHRVHSETFEFSGRDHRIEAPDILVARLLEHLRQRDGGRAAQVGGGGSTFESEPQYKNLMVLLLFLAEGREVFDDALRDHLENLRVDRSRVLEQPRGILLRPPARHKDVGVFVETVTAHSGRGLRY